MAFGIKRTELDDWKKKVLNGEIAFITHYWQHPRFPGMTTVTKAGCNDISKLIKWGARYNLQEEWIHQRDHYPHFDLIGETQIKVLVAEGLANHLQRFKIR